MGQFSLVYAPAPAQATYAHSYSLTIDYTQCGSSDDANFTVAVVLTMTSLKSVGNGGNIQNSTTFNGQTVPADVIFSSSSSYGSLLTWDIESWDQVNGILVAWVLLPNVSHTANTIFYMAVGNAAITTYLGGSVGSAWNSNYVLVSHLPNGTTLSAVDYSGNGNNGTITGITAAAGELGGAALFDAVSGDNIEYPMLSLVSSNNTITITMWFNRLINGGDFYYEFINFNTGLTCGLEFESETTTLYLWRGGTYRTYTTSNYFVDGDWHYLTVIFTGSGDSVNLYFDTVLQSTYTGSISSMPSITGSACLGGSGDYYHGYIDELQIVNTNISVDRMTKQFNNQKPSSTFISIATLY